MSVTIAMVFSHIFSLHSRSCGHDCKRPDRSLFFTPRMLFNELWACVYFAVFLSMYESVSLESQSGGLFCYT
jgi:hypothetical protein